VKELGSLYFVSGHRLAAGLLADLIADLASAGVGVVQLREKEMEAADVIRVAEPVADACRRVEVPFVVNDRPDIALAVGADGVHLGQTDLPVNVARRILGDAAIVGRSTHAPEEVDDESSRPGIDYIAVGPVERTPTKLGRPAAGIALVEHAARREADGLLKLPWYAIGGIDEANIEDVMAAGAKRIVVVRAIAEADDPIAAAGRLSAVLGN
jgi:thiamine-phosphate pyrophosphorylase